MSFISYAQNFEDVMLWRALKHVEGGTYVDVGAQHPVVDSVSKAFYEHGWRGVHVEPVPAYAELLRQDRPDETVLQLALSDREGLLELNVIPETGLSTAVKEYAARHLAELGFEHTTVSVPMLTMKTALQSLEGKDVHWLKIDVEGLEERVLRGWDAARLRPWIIVIEATVPSSPEVDYVAWEPLVTGAGYRFAYFDGLNRFYVSDEHPELMDAFTTPPNVFDGAQLSGQASSELCRGLIARNDAAMAEMRDRLAQANGAAARLATVEHDLAAERELNALLKAENESLSGFGHLTAHIEWMQRQQDEAQREAARLHAHIAWMQRQQDDSQREIARLHAHIDWMQGQSDAMLRTQRDLAAQAEGLRRQVQDIYVSTSWRVTSPMRRAVDLVRRFKRVARRLAGRSYAAPVPQPLAPVEAVIPGLAEEQVLRELSPRATQILAEIRQVIESKAH